MKKGLLLLYGGICLLSLGTTVNAILETRLGGLAVYDTDLNITWLADANAAAGTIYDNGLNEHDGRMTWANAKAWTESLDVYGITGWRLPTAAPACGFDCINSELEHHFYKALSGVAFSSIQDSTDSDLALFSNIQAFYYWSGTEMLQTSAKAFKFYDGGQGTVSKNGLLYAWAVHDGDVGLLISEPGTIALVSLGLIGLFGGRYQQEP
jgi:hypothetical protein